MIDMFTAFLAAFPRIFAIFVFIAFSSQNHRKIACSFDRNYIDEFMNPSFIVHRPKR